MGFKKGYIPWNKGASPETHPFFGKHHTQETKNKIAEKKKGTHSSPETEFKKGHKNSPEGIERTAQWNREHHENKFFKKGMVAIHPFPKGHIPFSKGTHIQTNTGKTHFKKGMIPWNKGTKFTKMEGENHWNWKGGKSFERYSQGWSEVIKEQVRERDGYKCIDCGIPQEQLNMKIGNLDVHHLDLDKKNHTLDNLVSLCRGCHIRRHNKATLQRLGAVI
jgi:hypothetical protein